MFKGGVGGKMNSYAILAHSLNCGDFHWHS